MWLPTLRSLSLRARGQYNILDTFITLALSAGEDPGWVANLCGTSEQIIFGHYRRWMKNLTRQDGQRVARVYGDEDPDGHWMGTAHTTEPQKPSIRVGKLADRGRFEPATLPLFIVGISSEFGSVFGQ